MADHRHFLDREEHEVHKIFRRSHRLLKKLQSESKEARDLVNLLTLADQRIRNEMGQDATFRQEDALVKNAMHIADRLEEEDVRMAVNVAKDLQDNIQTIQNLIRQRRKSGSRGKRPGDFSDVA